MRKELQREVAAATPEALFLEISPVELSKGLDFSLTIENHSAGKFVFEQSHCSFGVYRKVRAPKKKAYHVQIIMKKSSVIAMSLTFMFSLKKRTHC